MTKEILLPMQENKIEEEKKPRYRLMVTRHAERLPDGSLTPEGIEASIKKGVKMSKSAKVIKGYASDEKTKRTVFTSDYISEASETKSPLSNKQYKTRQEKGIQYDVLKPDLYDLLEQAKKVIDDVTIKEMGLPEGTVLSELPKDKQKEIAPIRLKNQELGLKVILDNSDATHRLSLGMAAQLIKEMEIAARHGKWEQKKEKQEEEGNKDIVLNTVTHGMMSESLFLESGYIKKEDGEIEKLKKEDIESEEFGGFIMPAESFYLEIDDPQNIPDMIPVSFEKASRPATGVVSLDKNKLQELSGEYNKRNK